MYNVSARDETAAEEEARRLQALHELGVLDTPPEAVFDELASLAAQLCGAPMAAVSLVDAERQWFKAQFGFELAQTPRSHALCAHAILDDSLLYIPDTLQEARFAQHPAVAGESRVRFYAGAPLVGSRGERYGTLCVFDTVPHALTESQRFALCALARQATAQFESRGARRWADARDLAMQSLIEALPEGVVVLGPDRRIHLLNRTARDWFGDAYEGSTQNQWAALGRVIDLSTGRELTAEEYPFARAMRGEALHDELILVETRDGRRVTLRCSAEPVVPADGVPTAAIFIGRRSGAPGSEPAAVASEALLRLIVDSIDKGVVTTDASGTINFFNREAARLAGRPGRDLCGMHVDRVFRATDPSDVPASKLFLLEQGMRTATPLGDARLVTPDGNTHEVTHRSLPILDSRGTAHGSLLLLRDVTSTNQLTRELEARATRDPQTGMANRLVLERRIGEVISRAKPFEHKHHVFYMDVDRFKMVNDSSGHVAGDRILAQTANVIRDALGRADVLGRLHGDEFVALVDVGDMAQAVALANEARAAVERHRFTCGEIPFALSLSIGVVPVAHGLTVDEVLGKALSMCELAKQQGRNRVLFHGPDDTDLIEHRVRLDQRAVIQRSLEMGRFALYGQRIEPLGHVHGQRHVEVLVRLVDDEGKLVAPGAFIPVAERYGLMPAVDRHVVSHAFAALQRCPPGDRPLLAINLSGHSLADSAFADYVSAQFRTHRIGFPQVCFEITETAAISDIVRAEHFIQRFRDLGCRFSLDDFGSGMSSFSYLKRLQVDFLKIDGCFVRQLLEDRFDQAMVRAVQSVATSTGLQTIAEYVETSEILEELRAIGIDYVQGYGVHRPEPLDALLRAERHARLW